MKVEMKCDICGSENLILKSSKVNTVVLIVCVYNDIAIDEGPDWRNYEDNNTDGDRSGMPSTQLLHDKGLTTDITR